MYLILMTCWCILEEKRNYSSSQKGNLWEYKAANSVLYYPGSLGSGKGTHTYYKQSATVFSCFKKEENGQYFENITTGLIKFCK